MVFLGRFTIHIQNSEQIETENEAASYEQFCFIILTLLLNLIIFLQITAVKRARNG